MSGDSDERLRLFLLEQVASYEQLEALLLLARDAERELSDAEIAAALRVPVASMEEALRGLAGAGELVEAREQSGILLYRYAPRDDARRASTIELQRAYEERRLRVVQMMNANALERVRGAAMRRLADAFRVEKARK